jgi:hypothetical protein
MEPSMSSLIRKADMPSSFLPENNKEGPWICVNDDSEKECLSTIEVESKGILLLPVMYSISFLLHD